MKPCEEMNLTVYLQTEGRRRAAELAAAAVAAPGQRDVASGSLQQSQTAVDLTQRLPQSLSEFLQCMGIEPSPVSPAARVKHQRQL